MENTNTQPEAGTQEAVNTPVADNLGKFDERSIAEFVKNNFLNEEGAAPAKEEQQTESEVEEPTTEESSEVDAEAQDDVDQSTDEGGDESSLSRGVQKRINKLVAAKKAAQAKLQEQEARLVAMQRELEATRSIANSGKQQPVSKETEGLNSIPEVEAEYRRAVDVLLWCEENPDGGEIQTPDGKTFELSDQQVRTMKKVALRNKEVELPARFNYLQQQQAAVQGTLQVFPWWTKPETEEYQTAASIVQEFPEIRRRPDWMYLAGVVVEGLRSVTERANKTKAAAPIRRAPAQPAVKAPPVANKNEPLAKATKSFIADPSDRNGLSDLLKAKGFV